MTALFEAPGATAAAGATEPGTPAATPGGADRWAGRWRRWRWGLASVGILLLATLIAVLTLPRGSGVELDPGNPGPRGAGALAEVLRDQGVEVVRVRRSDAAARSATAGTTLVVVDNGVLGPQQLGRLAAAGTRDVVLVQPDTITLRELAPGVQPDGGRPAEVRRPGCSVPAARAAGETQAGGAVYRLRPGAGGAVCYAEDGAGPYVVRSLVADGRITRTVTVLGQPLVLHNARVADDGNAALALRTLGRSTRLVWYLPDPLEISTAAPAPTPGELLPDWVRWVAVQLVVAVLVAMLWRSRRHGRLVPEPLPVVVRAAETQEGRARLYRQASARGRAAGALRTATMRRLASRLAVPAGTTPERVAALAAGVAGRTEPGVRDVLLGPAPQDDAALVRLATELDRIEQDVGRAAAGRPPAAPRTDDPAGRNQQP